MKGADALSPVDGRYAKEVEELRDIFSEKAFFRERILVSFPIWMPYAEMGCSKDSPPL